MTPPRLTPASFAFTVALSLKKSGIDSNWAPLALQAVGKAAGVRGKADGNWGFESIDGGPRGKVVVGLSVVKFRKNELVVSYAAFNSKRQVTAWSFDHAPPPWRKTVRMALRSLEDGTPVELTAERRERLLAVAGAKRVTASPVAAKKQLSRE